MEIIQNDERKTNILDFIKKISKYAIFIYNIIWGVIFGILIYNRNSSNSLCNEIVNWVIACFSFCIICPLKTFFLAQIEKIWDISKLYIQFVSLISSCSISIIFVTGLSTQKYDDNFNDFCLNCVKTQTFFIISESIYIVYFLSLFIYLLYDLCKENYIENGMISVKTIE